MVNEIKLKDLEIFNPFYFLDVDCTLIKSLEPIVRELNKRYHTNLKPKDIKSWNFAEVKNDLASEEIEELFSLSQFFSEVEFYDGAREFLNKNRKNCMIVTKGTYENIKQKRLFFDLNGFEDIPIIGLELPISKSFVNMKMEGYTTVFIDDGTKNLNDSNADIKIQFREFGDTEWNENWKGMVMKSWIC